MESSHRISVWVMVFVPTSWKNLNKRLNKTPVFFVDAVFFISSAFLAEPR